MKKLLVVLLVSLLTTPALAKGSFGGSYGGSYGGGRSYSSSSYSSSSYSRSYSSGYSRSSYSGRPQVSNGIYRGSITTIRSYRSYAAAHPYSVKTVSINGRTFRYDSNKPPIIYSRNRTAFLYNGPRTVVHNVYYTHPYGYYGYSGYYGFGYSPFGFIPGSDFWFWMFYFHTINNMNQQQISSTLAVVPTARATPQSLNQCTYYDKNGKPTLVSTPDPCPTDEPDSFATDNPSN